MKAAWLLVILSLELKFVSTYCPEKCLCLWYTDNSLTINCSGSEQTEVPYGIDPQVKVLDLSFNDITSYNHSRYLKAVEEIDLSNNKITQAYFGGSFKYLKYINLSYNFIQDLRKVDVENLQNLSILNLSHNSKLQRASGLKSISLEYLDLSHCFISKIQEDFLENVPNIKSIDISHNFFSSLKNITSDSLVSLDASNGRLENLTQYEIFNMPYLMKLNASFNTNLKVNFSFENSCWNVKQLDLSNSDLTSLDMFPFCSLETFNGSANKIKIIEVRTFFNNCELIFANLSKNQIYEIDNQSFFMNHKLKILDLSVNQIQNVQFTLHLREVLYLDLSTNSISNLANLILRKATDLNLSNNRIKDIAINFNENTPKLKRLNLSYNKIKTIIGIHSRSISQLDLSHCKISWIDIRAFEKAEELMQINLAGNKLTTLDFRIFKSLKNLKDIMLSNNQWSCNCKSQEFKELYEFLTVDHSLANIKELLCVSTNDTWRNTCLDAWHKDKEWKKTVYSLTVSLAIALIVIAVIFFCKYFNDKKQMEDTERIARERRENIGRRLSSFQHNEPEEVPNDSIYSYAFAPPPDYEAAILLPKLTEEQKNMAISTLSIASPIEDTDNEQSDEPIEMIDAEGSQETRNAGFSRSNE